VITGAGAQVACWQQKAGVANAPILWDYHVVLAVHSDGWCIWDLDGRLQTFGSDRGHMRADDVASDQRARHDVGGRHHTRASGAGPGRNQGPVGDEIAIRIGFRPTSSRA
jgi:hypothetical protein